MLDFYRGTLSARRAHILIRKLKPGASLWAELGLDQAWTAGEHLAAMQADLLAGANWQRANGNGRRPEPVPRPGDIKREQDREMKTVARALKFRQTHGNPQN